MAGDGVLARAQEQAERYEARIATQRATIDWLMRQRQRVFDVLDHAEELGHTEALYEIGRVLNERRPPEGSGAGVGSGGDNGVGAV